MHIQSLTGKWQFRQAGSNEEWLSAQVPGGVHTDLMAAGRIPDPFVSDNELRVQWVAESDWEYRINFDGAAELLVAEQVFLVCDGLDTLAELTLNGERLGKTDNMFRQYRWDVKPLLRERGNALLILFRGPVAYITPLQRERALRGVAAAIPGSPYVRKAPCQFGWDWGPKLPPIGIWKDIRLEGRDVGRLKDVHLRQHHQDGAVSVEAALQIERWSDAPLTADMHITAPDGSIFTTQAAVEDASLTLLAPIPEPQLWWPNGYPSGVQPGAEQALYQVELTLTANGEVKDRRTYQVGLRTLELRREKDTWGESFTFVVNGVPIFAKGSNWIPADSFPTRISDAHLERLIRDAAVTHHNMLRVWGGGFYEEERFYDLCDRYGILIWQDFIFSCGIYPLNDDDFVENVRIEVLENVRRLRHRASLALWCGNNEMEWGWVIWGWDTPQHADLKAAYDQFFHHTLPEWCAAEDPGTAYWPSSPSSGKPFDDPNAETLGDAHYWMVWHGGLPFSAFRLQYPRFMSEFGFQSLPHLDTIRTYAEPADWNMTSYIMEHHQRSPIGNSKIITYMTDYFRLPMSFESLVYLSQVLQAEAIRFGVEHWRRNGHRTSGTLYWQLNDTWPVASWASVDYFGRWKALHYAARRFYAPVLLSMEDGVKGDPTKIGLYVTSDLTEPWSGTVRWALESLDGDVLANVQDGVRATPMTTTHISTLDLDEHVTTDNQRELVFICELLQQDERVALTLATFVPNKHLALKDPQLRVDVRQDGDQFVFELQAQSLARFVELALSGADVVFSDNFVDVPAGRTISVTCSRPTGWTLDQARTALQVRSLYDSFA